MATATADATTADLTLLLADGERPAAEVLAAVPERVLAAAWAAGLVEFGRRAHSVSGRPGVPESKPTLYLEDGVHWTGPKRQSHKTLKGVLADAARVPECVEYRRYVKEVSAGKDESGVERFRVAAAVPEGQEFRWNTAKTDRAEAAAELGLLVRLTDKGLAALA
jgi:hypothetical protein